MNIKIDDRFSLSPQKNSWTVIETYEGKSKNGASKRQTRESYFKTLKQACNHILDESLKVSKNTQEILSNIKIAEDHLAKFLDKPSN